VVLLQKVAQFIIIVLNVGRRHVSIFFFNLATKPILKILDTYLHTFITIINLYDFHFSYMHIIINKFRKIIMNR